MPASAHHPRIRAGAFEGRVRVSKRAVARYASVMGAFDFDAVVVGAGVVGLGCGYALSRRGLVVAVLEAEAAIGQGVSSRNSEVIHGGMYYPTGSLKARLCVEGSRQLYDFCERHQVPHARVGKIITALTPEELPRLEALLDLGLANGVEMRRLGAEETRRME